MKAEKSVGLGERMEQYVAAVGARGLRNTIKERRMIHIVSKGVVFTPDGGVKKLEDLSEEELASDPYIASLCEGGSEEEISE